MKENNKYRICLLIVMLFLSFYSYAQSDSTKTKQILTRLSDSALSNISFFVGRWNYKEYDETKSTEHPSSKKNKQSNKINPLLIYNDFTFMWEVNGVKINGKWERTGKVKYPIVLLKAIEKKDWLVGRDLYGAKIIFIGDGMFNTYSAIPF